MCAYIIIIWLKYSLTDLLLQYFLPCILPQKKKLILCTNSLCACVCVSVRVCFNTFSGGVALHAKKHHIHATTTGSAPLRRRTLAKTIRNNHILINIRRGVCMSVKIIIRIIVISMVLLLPSNGGEYIYI